MTTRTRTLCVFMAALCALLLGGTATAQGGTVIRILPASQDNYTHAGQPDTVQNPADTALLLMGGAAAARHPFIDFDISSLAGMTEQDIISATLKLRAHYSNNGQQGAPIGRITQAWDENTLTWNNAPEVTDDLGIVMYGTAAGDGYNNTFDVTTMVQNWVSGAWPAHGVRLRYYGSPHWHQLNFTSSNNPSAYKPIIEVVVDELAVSTWTLTLPASQDNYIVDGDPNAQNPTNTSLYLMGGTATFHRPFIDFDISLLDEIPTEDIISATLKLRAHYSNNGGHGAPIGRVTEPWNEATITWDNAPAVVEDLGIIMYGTAEGAGYNNTFDVTDLLRNWHSGVWPAHGIRLRYYGSTHWHQLNFTSSNSTSAYKPVIDVRVASLPGTIPYTPPGDWPNSATEPDPNNPATDANGTWTAFWHDRHDAPHAPMRILTASTWSVDNYWMRTAAGGYPMLRSFAANRQRFGVSRTDVTFTDNHGWSGLAFTPNLPEDYQGTARVTGMIDHNYGTVHSSATGAIMVQLYQLSATDEVNVLAAKRVAWQTTWDFDFETYVSPGDTFAVRVRCESYHSDLRPELWNFQVELTKDGELDPPTYPEPGPWEATHTVDATAAGKTFSREILGQNWFMHGAERISDRVQVRGTEGGLFANYHDWQTLGGIYRSPGNTLDFLSHLRDVGSWPIITANHQGVGYGTYGDFTFTDTSAATMAALAADWVRYANFIAQGEPLTAGDQDILNKITWTPKLPDPGEDPLPKVMYWQIGNEVDNYPDYAERYKAITSAMLAVDPTINVGISGMWLFAHDTDNAVRQALDDPDAQVDFLCYHPYHNIGDSQGNIPEMETRLGQIRTTQRTALNNTRATVAAAGRDPDALEYFATEWNSTGWHNYWCEGTQLQALASAETLLNFADFADDGLRGANFWGNVEAVDWYTEYPIFKVFEAMQTHLGDTLLDRYSDGQNLRIYTVRDSQTGQITVWALNFSDDTAKTMKLSLTGLGNVGSATQMTLAGLHGTGGLINSNIAGNVVFVDWTSRDLDVNEVDFNEYVIAYEPASITVLMIEPAPLPGDANLDGVVDLHDFAILAAHYGQDGLGWTEGDFTGDGAVTFEDFIVLASNFLAKDPE